MKILVCGGRDYSDLSAVFSALDKIHSSTPVSLIIEGGAQGADRLARQWAKSRQVPVRTFPADWSTHGRAAGPIRNAQMLREGKPDLVIAFPGGRGTENMTSQAKAVGVRVITPEQV